MNLAVSVLKYQLSQPPIEDLLTMFTEYCATYVYLMRLQFVDVTPAQCNAGLSCEEQH